MENRSKQLASLIADKLIADEDFHNKLSTSVAQKLLNERDRIRSSFDSVALVSFLTNKKSPENVVNNITGNNVNSSQEQKKQRENKVKEKKTQSAFYSKVPPKVQTPLKRGDSVTDIVSKLYTLTDRSIVRKKKEEKEKKKLEVLSQRKKQKYNKNLLKSLSGLGSKIGHNITDSEIPWWLLPVIAAFLNKDKLIPDESTVAAGLPFATAGLGRGLRNLAKKMPDAKFKEPPVKKPVKEESKPTPKEEPVSKEETAPKEEPKTTPKEKPVPKRKGLTEKAQRLKARSEELKSKAKARTATPAPNTPSPAAAPKPTSDTGKATKSGRFADKAERIASWLTTLARQLPKETLKALGTSTRALPWVITAGHITKSLADYKTHQDENKLKSEVASELAALAGGTMGFAVGRGLGGWAGAAIGSLIGSVVPGAGNFVGLIGGGIGGIAAGGYLAEKSAEMVPLVKNYLMEHPEVIENLNLPEMPTIPKELLDKLSDESALLEEKTEFSKGLQFFDDTFGAITQSIMHPIDTYHSIENSAIEKYNSTKKSLAETIGGVQGSLSETGAEIGRIGNNISTGIAKLFEGTARYATITADYINTGDALTSLERAREQIELAQPSGQRNVNVATSTSGGKSVTSSVGGSVKIRDEKVMNGSMHQSMNQSGSTIGSNVGH